MDNRSAKLIGRRKAGTWGKPHKDLRADANRGTRKIGKRVLKGGKSKLLGKDET